DAGKNASPCLTQKAPYKGPGADSEEKREPVSDIDTAAADSLKVLDPKRPIREADVGRTTLLWVHALVIWNASSPHYRGALGASKESAYGECMCAGPAHRGVSSECSGTDLFRDAGSSSPCCPVAIERCRVILRCADGLASKDVAAELGLHEHTVGKWRRRFLKDRCEGL